MLRQMLSSMPEGLNITVIESGRSVAVTEGLELLLVELKTFL